MLSTSAGQGKTGWDPLCEARGAARSKIYGDLLCGLTIQSETLAPVVARADGAKSPLTLLHPASILGMNYRLHVNIHQQTAVFRLIPYRLTRTDIMTIAELHGKLSPDRPHCVHDRMEDLLTSDVFGTMKYAGLEHGFMNWFLQAEPAPIDPTPPPVRAYLDLERIAYADYSFWPTLKNRLEPDVAILVTFEEGDALLILVEAKYQSGVGDWAGDEQPGPQGLTGNQIADQMRGLEQMSVRGLREWFEGADSPQGVAADGTIHRIHLFVTTHTSLPEQDYELATRRLGSPWPLPAYWLSWTSLAECLSDHLDKSDRCVRELIVDLYRLLHRKGLVPFRGFSMEPWHSSSSQPSFWREDWWSYPPLVVGEHESFWETSR